MDLFDAIRGAMYLFRNEFRSVPVGLSWCYEWDQTKIIINEPGTPSGGHLVNAVGWKIILGEPHLKIQNSYGKEWGEGGFNYLSRRVINEMAICAFMVKDRPDNLTHDDVVLKSISYRVNFLMRVLLYLKAHWAEIMK